MYRPFDTPSSAPSACTQPAASQKPAGAFALCAGRALSLTPQEDSVLRISQGGAWVTLPSLPGDHFLQAGDCLRVPAGDAVVLEGWKMPATQTLYFDWNPVPMQLAAQAGVAVRGSWFRLANPAGAGPAAGACNSAAAWAQPLADLRAALVMAGRATALAGVALPRLAGALLAVLVRGVLAGVAGFATTLIAGCAYPARETYDFFFADEAERAFNAQSRASKAQVHGILRVHGFVLCAWLVGGRISESSLVRRVSVCCSPSCRST